MQMQPFSRQRGLTLVELLVAVALASLVAIAAVASLIVARQGFTSVDTATQLRDNGRFAAGLMRRIILQGGYVSTQYAIDRSHQFKLDATAPEPYIKGFNNARYVQSLAIGTTNTVGSSARGINNSDMLVVRYQSGQTITGGVTDEAMINCSGATATAPVNVGDRMFSAFHIATSTTTGEPTLMCTWFNDSGTESRQPLIEGVESLQILYGTYGVTPNTAPTALAANTLTPPPDRYLRADQLVVSGDDAATIANWERVRSVRIGLVLRGPTGSAPETTVPAQYPFGKTKQSGDASSVPDSMMVSTDDPGSSLAAQSDGRLRQTLTFTVHLRNPQDAL
ncbi:PilW family protein [Comamonas aquatica]|uniref:PilW family protein n=1 Tax=Comamonas aquatica TaxID=225991 RepID=UPI00244BB161|nr:PilW family protein [Comamonas aquatica]MDH0494677.1 PilW family protein [Comamonas aquatica]